MGGHGLAAQAGQFPRSPEASHRKVGTVISIKDPTRLCPGKVTENRRVLFLSQIVEPEDLSVERPRILNIVNRLEQRLDPVPVNVLTVNKTKEDGGRTFGDV